MLILAGPSGASAHDGGNGHPEQPGRIFSVMDGARDLHLDSTGEFLSSLLSLCAHLSLARVALPCFWRGATTLEHCGHRWQPFSVPCSIYQ